MEEEQLKVQNAYNDQSNFETLMEIASSYTQVLLNDDIPEIRAAAAYLENLIFPKISEIAYAKIMDNETKQVSDALKIWADYEII